MPPLLVTAAIITKGQDILITRRPTGSQHAGLWEFPGGKMEEGETPETCLERELLEELGVRTVVDEIFHVVFHRYAWGDVLLLAYRCRLLDRTIRDLGVAEHRWVRPEHLTHFTLLPADAPLIAKLQRPACSAASS